MQGRLERHPVIDHWQRGRKVTFYFNGQVMEGYETETIAAALHANGIRVLGYSSRLHRPRGLFCALGQCSSCLMKVDGVPNVRVCMEKLREGMRVESQRRKGDLLAQD